MARLIDATQDRLLGDVSEADRAVLLRVLGEADGGDHHIDNDTFLALVDAGASSTLLDAVKSALDLSGETRIRCEGG
jgi:hypothetical protein